MTGQTQVRTAVTVGTNDLRHALVSVAKHASNIPEIPSIYRIRLQIDRVNVTVSATDRFSAGVAIVSIVAPADPVEGIIDLTPDNVREILAVFKGGKEKDDEPEWLLQIETDDTHVIITDVSGMIDGKSLSIVQTPIDDGFPSLDVAVSRALRGDLVMLEDLIVDGERIALFQFASGQYHKPLKIEARTGTKALVIHCGDSFLGMCYPNRVDKTFEAELAVWERDWRNRLPDPATPLANSAATRDSGASDVDINDDILGDAVALIQTTQTATRGLLQKRLRISPVHADELLEELEELGVVSPPGDHGIRAVRIHSDGVIPEPDPEPKDGA